MNWTNSRSRLRKLKKVIIITEPIAKIIVCRSSNRPGPILKDVATGDLLDVLAATPVLVI